MKVNIPPEISYSSDVFCTPIGLRKIEPEISIPNEKVTPDVQPDSTEWPSETVCPKPIHEIYEKRIEELTAFASEEEDHPGVRNESKRDFWKFMGSVFFEQEVSVVLMDNGNLGATWEMDNEGKNVIEIDFLGENLANYLLVREGASPPQIFHASGTDTLKGVKEQIRVFIKQMPESDYALRFIE